MRKVLALVAVVGFITPVAADDAKLKVGDKAPPVRATKWLQGAEVKEFTEGKTYVMEFWATWCEPCIVMMPHLGALQAEYKSKGVTVIGFSAKDPNNSLEKVQTLVERRGPKLGYTFAYADNAETYDAWMNAAGREGLPCAFVVDGTGKIAYIGRPMFLDEVLPKVVAGKWTEADAEEMKKTDAEVDALFKSFRGDAEAALKALTEFETKHPKLAGIPYFNSPRITLLLKTKQMEEAKKTAEAIVAKAMKQDDPTALTAVSGALRSPAANGDKELLALSLKAAESALKIAGDKDIFTLLAVAEAYFATGEKVKAKEFGAKAVAAAEKESDGLKKYVEGQVKKFDDEKKDK